MWAPKIFIPFSNACLPIINNAKLNIDTYLGELEEKSGKEIQFGKRRKRGYLQPLG